MSHYNNKDLNNHLTSSSQSLICKSRMGKNGIVVESESVCKKRENENGQINCQKKSLKKFRTKNAVWPFFCEDNQCGRKMGPRRERPLAASCSRYMLLS